MYHTLIISPAGIVIESTRKHLKKQFLEEFLSPADAVGLRSAMQGAQSGQNQFKLYSIESEAHIAIISYNPKRNYFKIIDTLYAENKIHEIKNRLKRYADTQKKHDAYRIKLTDFKFYRRYYLNRQGCIVTEDEKQWYLFSFISSDYGRKIKTAISKALDKDEASFLEYQGAVGESYLAVVTPPKGEGHSIVVMHELDLGVIPKKTARKCLSEIKNGVDELEALNLYF